MLKVTKIDDYEFKEVIGKGKISEIYLASKDQTSEKFAIKRYLREIAEKDNSILRDLKNEIVVLRKINHPNIIKFKDIKKTKKAFYLIYEYCNGEKLSKIINDYIQIYNKKLPEEIVQKLMKQIIDAFEYINSKKICFPEFEDLGYLDNDRINIGDENIKLDNILVDFNSETDKEKINLIDAKIKMINFKKAYYYHDNSDMREGNINLSKTREKNIIFCIGKICYKLLTGKPPFEGKNLGEFGNYFIPNNLSIEAINFLNSTLQKSEQFRVSLKDIHKLDFLSKNKNDFHFCDFSGMANFDKLNLNIKGIIVNINNDKYKEYIKVKIQKENKELTDKENPFSNLKESLEIDINSNEDNGNNNLPIIKDSVQLYLEKYRKKPK